MSVETVGALLVAAVVAMVTQLGAVALKRTRSIDNPAPTIEQRVMDEWQQLAVESRRELGECRQDKQRQDDVIKGQGRRIEALEALTRKQDKKIDDIQLELGQWRDGRRVPDGYRLQRLEPPWTPPSLHPPSTPTPE